MTGEAEPCRRSAEAGPVDGQRDAQPAPEFDAARLCRPFTRFHDGREASLTPGMLAVWKPGLKNRTLPDYGQPAIVMDVLEEPNFDPSDRSRSPYFREPLDLLLGVLTRDDDFLLLHFDARRFEPACD